MKLIGFRIQNFRSIVDTGWTDLSPDNITGLIGQNESGKTSILEALDSFYTGTISEDILRSDLSLPCVYCRFKPEEVDVEKSLDEKLLPDGMIEKMKEIGTVCLKRSYAEDITSHVELAGDEILKIYKNFYKKREDEDKVIREKIEEAIDEHNSAIKAAEKAFKDKEDKFKDIESAKESVNLLQKKYKLEKNGESKEIASENFNHAKRYLEECKNNHAAAGDIAEKKAAEARMLSENTNLARESIDAQKRFQSNKKELDISYKELQKCQRIFDMSNNENDRRASRSQLDSSNETYVKVLREYEQSKEDYIRKKVIAFKVLSGGTIDAVRSQVKKEKPHLDKYYSLEEAGRKLFNFVPEFIFFEDFSSLLPDRIDLHDILTENTNIEGYKAAKNFLIISGLDEDFFQQTNTRILKHKIEKLNKEITIDFQDYWRQKIGKHNKIKINFELEHYDYSNPDKSGLPYIEFWIKDKEQSLYPKQRSRGVRWFLSFYLELQAAALSENRKNIVILIDEPGVSLHAKAQEDVLEVFDNIKQDVQIIYTTHSPYLIDLNKLYRLLAVQRAVEEDEASETRIFNAKSLSTASSDTLSPLYSLMGIRLSEYKFIQKKNNVILEDIATFYYLKAITDMKNFKKQVFYLPATGASNVRNLVNMLLGWGIDFIVLTGANKEGNDLIHDLTKHLHANDEDMANKKLIQLDQFNSIEDLFSTIDFKKFILHERIGIPETNSEFIRHNNLSRSILASNFMREFKDSKLKWNDLDEETRGNFSHLFDELDKRLQ